MYTTCEDLAKTRRGQKINLLYTHTHTHTPTHTSLYVSSVLALVRTVRINCNAIPLHFHIIPFTNESIIVSSDELDNSQCPALSATVSQLFPNNFQIFSIQNFVSAWEI